jgi:hypothetical protein
MAKIGLPAVGIRHGLFYLLPVTDHSHVPVCSQVDDFGLTKYVLSVVLADVSLGSENEDKQFLDDGAHNVTVFKSEQQLDQRLDQFVLPNAIKDILAV